jgi:hypothetical protein
MAQSNASFRWMFYCLVRIDCYLTINETQWVSKHRAEYYCLTGFGNKYSLAPPTDVIVRRASMPVIETSDAEADTLAILARLRSGWRPSRELADASVLERWRLFAPGPYLLQGWVGMSLKSGIAFAFDPAAGWVRFVDRWARLGAPALAQPLPSNEAVMGCVTIALAGRDGAAEIRAEARALADRARDAGLPTAAYLLDMAALELSGGAS